MSGRIRHITSHHRELLLTGWSLCATAADAVDDAPPPADDAGWLTAPTLGPHAAVLRARGEWSFDDPPHRFDDQDVWYRLRFDAPTFPVDLDQPRPLVILGFDGLATVSQAWLNGELLLSSESMFLAHELDVSHRLQPQGNELLLRFRALDTQLNKRRPRPRWRAPMIENQQLRWFRTTLLGRTPGWSPPSAVVGPWGDIWLEQRHAVNVSELQLTARLEGEAGALDVALDLEALGKATVARVVVELNRNGQRHSQPLIGNPTSPRFAGSLLIEQVDRWWPHTHGEPALYDAQVQVYLHGVETPVCMDLGAVGFRSVTVDTGDGDFAVKVNGVAVFCRGACWTPLDVVTLRATPEAYTAAIAQACAAGMNMLRVTGTMAYEAAAFFDACDAQGMLVWQDFMFANMDYPETDESFMASAKAEVTQQLRFWQARPSLTVLCGNSEVEQQAAMWGTPRELWSPALFHQHIARWCKEHGDGVPYWPSSAHGGAFPFQADVGTTSYYGVGAYLRPLEDARLANVRFATECLAFANVPALSTAARLPTGHAVKVHHAAWKARSPRDLGAGWDFDDVRDHYLASTFGLDPQKLRYSDHDRYLTLSRVATGLAMAATFTEWRRATSNCRGALVLFLRDLWPAAGWGLVDDSGVPKASYQYLKQALQPLSVGLTDEGVNGLFVHLVNERSLVQDLDLEISVWRDGEILIAKAQRSIQLQAHTTQSCSAMSLFDNFSDLSYAYRFGPLTQSATTAVLRDATGEVVARAFHFAAGLSEHRETDVGLSASVHSVSDGGFELIVRTRRLAQAVHFDIPGFDAEDEYFHLYPGEERRIPLRRLAGARPPEGTACAINAIATARLEFWVDRSVAP